MEHRELNDGEKRALSLLQQAYSNIDSDRSYMIVKCQSLIENLVYSACEIKRFECYSISSGLKSLDRFYQKNGNPKFKTWDYHYKEFRDCSFHINSLANKCKHPPNRVPSKIEIENAIEYCVTCAHWYFFAFSPPGIKKALFQQLKQLFESGKLPPVFNHELQLLEKFESEPDQKRLFIEDDTLLEEAEEDAYYYEDEIEKYKYEAQRAHEYEKSRNVIRLTADNFKSTVIDSAKLAIVHFEQDHLTVSLDDPISIQEYQTRSMMTEFAKEYKDKIIVGEYFIYEWDMDEEGEEWYVEDEWKVKYEIGDADSILFFKNEKVVGRFVDEFDKSRCEELLKKYLT